jgi:hypothetical protein
MEKTYKRWRKQLDDFDGAMDDLPALEQDMRVWGTFAPAVPALFDAVIRESAAYRASASELRRWMDAHEREFGEPDEFGRRLRSCIEGARRLKGLIDALNREKSMAEAAYPEMAGGSLKDTKTVALGAPMEAEKAAVEHKNGSGPAVRAAETPGNHDPVNSQRPPA